MLDENHQGHGRYPDSPVSHAAFPQQSLQWRIGMLKKVYRCRGSTGISPVSRLTYHTISTKTGRMLTGHLIEF
jgi:hypothetical protein